MRIVRADSPDCGCNTDSDNAVSFRALSKHCRRPVRSKKLNDEHHVARRAYVGSNAKRRPIESLSSWRVLKHASLEFEKCGSGFRKVTHTVARFILTKPELQRNLRCSVALNQYASAHSLTHQCLTQIQAAAEPESLSLFLSVPEQHSGGVSLWNTRRSPAR